MAKPTTREEFKQWCLRRIGQPVTEINVDDDQLEDRIDEALQYWKDYHYLGSNKVYISHQLSAADITNKYISVDETIQSITQVFPIGDPVGTGSDIFNIRYQIALNDLYSLTSVSMVPYYMAMEHISLIKELLVGRQQIRFNRHRNVVNIDMDWDQVQEGEYIILEGYEELDETVYTDIWNDRWLKDYASTLFEYQWGYNLTKFTGIQMAGGVEFNGDRIMDRATQRKKELEDEMLNSYSLPVTDLVG